MVKRIVYIHPGDMVELRLCNPDYPAMSSEWREQTRPDYMTIRIDECRDVEVFDTITHSVFSGTGRARVQMLKRP